MSVFDTLVGHEHAQVKQYLKVMRWQLPKDRKLYLDDIVKRDGGQRLRDLVWRAWLEERAAADAEAPHG